MRPTASAGSRRFAAFLDVVRRGGRARAARRGRVSAGSARSDAGFPPRLGSIHDPPPGLFLRGDGRRRRSSAAPSVAIVGARACSDYGAHVARSLARELAAAGVVVISGLARGVDGWAHRGCLEAGGATVAVLGCGIDRDYPRAHAALARRDRRDAASSSPSTRPASRPRRGGSRPATGSSRASPLATVVVEARERSGALITADLALEEGREVLAVPGEITSALSQGANALLRLGATPVTCAGDVLEAIGIEPPDVPDGDPPGPGAASVLAALAQGASTADEVARAVGLDPAAVSAALIELELAGLVEVRAGIYRRLRGAAT